MTQKPMVHHRLLWRTCPAGVVGTSIDQKSGIIRTLITVKASATNVCAAICGNGGAIKVKYSTAQKRKDAPRQKIAIRSRVVVVGRMAARVTNPSRRETLYILKS